MCIDSVYINGVEFLVNIERQVKYRSIIHITSQNEELIFKDIDNIFQNYISSGFTITIIHTDNKFKPLMDKVKYDMDVTTNHANLGHHVPKIWKNKRTVRER